jgi:hypothetical protein
MVDQRLPNPWPRKPPKDARCDATIGSGSDAIGQPVIYGCRQMAVETLWSVHYAVVSRETWLCAEHVLAYVEKGYAVRNPRRRAA